MIKSDRFNFNVLQYLCLLMAVFMPFQGLATHQRAAEIIYRHVSELTYEITLISYTYTPSPANAYRDNLTIDWGDGIISSISRVERRNLDNDITYNRYTGQHSYLAPSTYIITCEDPNRNGGILNIPNSINTPLFIYSELVISPFLGGYNNSPMLLIPPIDNGCVDQPFYHNPGAYDPDGDSLSYRLVPCLGAQGKVIPGYTLPPATHFLKLDSVTGDLYWDSPPQMGEYNIAILIEEWRNGMKIGSVERDMQIIISACDSRPPVILPLQDTCVEAGKTLTFNVKAYDPDSTVVRLSGTGGPFKVAQSPATLNPDTAIGQGHTQTTFRWNTKCSHVIRSPYTVFFKAVDSGTPVNLVNISSMRILVVGPSPENLIATPLGTSITLNWDDYACSNASGYYIYRKEDSTGFVHGYCETGVPSYLGYSKIDEISGISVTTYTDNNKGSGLKPGIKYCYMVVAWYHDRAEGYASNEACASLKKDVPVITNVSVNVTSESNGSIYVAWSKPTELDTIQAPGPYQYIVNRSLPDSRTQFSGIAFLQELNDTIFTDTLMDTKNHSFSYRIDLYNQTSGNEFLIGSSQVATSMFLQIAPTDKELKLSWSNEVPWNNEVFTIFRKLTGSGSFDSIGYSPVPSYSDKGLKNGIEYCYYIQSSGKYSSTGFIDPIINLSQESCGVPYDNIPPCPPVLHDSTNCLLAENYLSWTNVYDSCSEDIVKYYIYYSPCNTGNFSLIDSLAGINDTTYLHQPDQTIAGCYAVVAVDSVGNRSGYSNQACITVNQCTAYTIPNIFTPNGDGINDLLIPVPGYTSVNRIELQVIDRWGREVFNTDDPGINWTGNDITTGQPCSDGAYMYICNVYETDLCGEVMRTLKGSVSILR